VESIYALHLTGGPSAPSWLAGRYIREVASALKRERPCELIEFGSARRWVDGSEMRITVVITQGPEKMRRRIHAQAV
jgi:hypothetical protein